MNCPFCHQESVLLNTSVESFDLTIGKIVEVQMCKGCLSNAIKLLEEEQKHAIKNVV